MILILLFVILIAFPGFYIITRAIFPRGAKRTAAWIAGGLTLLLVLILLGVLLGFLIKHPLY